MWSHSYDDEKCKKYSNASVYLGFKIAKFCSEIPAAPCIYNFKYSNMIELNMKTFGMKQQRISTEISDKLK